MIELKRMIREGELDANRTIKNLKGEGMMNKCAVCGKYVIDLYIVYQNIWKQSGLKPEDECCLDCLPGKLGRELNMPDFTDSPANRQIIFGYRMGRRPFEAEEIPEMPPMEPTKYFHTESEM